MTAPLTLRLSTLRVPIRRVVGRRSEPQMPEPGMFDAVDDINTLVVIADTAPIVTGVKDRHSFGDRTGTQYPGQAVGSPFLPIEEEGSIAVGIDRSGIPQALLGSFA